MYSARYSCSQKLGLLMVGLRSCAAACGFGFSVPLRLCGKILCLSANMANGAAGRLPLARGLPPKSEILIHRDFFVQGVLNHFKVIQGISRVLDAIIFYFYAPISKNPVPMRQCYHHQMELGGCPESFRSWSFCIGSTVVRLFQPIYLYLLLFTPFWPPPGGYVISHALTGRQRHPFRILCNSTQPP